MFTLGFTYLLVLVYDVAVLTGFDVVVTLHRSSPCMVVLLYMISPYLYVLMASSAAGLSGR